MSELNIYDLGLLILKEAVREGATEAEVYLVKSRDIESNIQNNKITQTASRREGGIGLRVAVGKKIGFASTNRTDRTVIERMVRKAVSIAKASREDPGWESFPSPQTYVVPKNIFSAQLAETREKTIFQKTSELLNALTSDKRITVIYGGVSVSRTSIAVLNTNGLGNIQHLTRSIVFAETVASEAGYTTPAVSVIDYSRTCIPSIEKLAKKLLSETLSCLKPFKISPGEYPVVMLTPALESLFRYTMFHALSGDSVIRGKSPYKDKLNESIASDKLTIIDDGMLNQGLFTAIFDGEGIPMKKKTLIDKGVLKQFLLDHYWANKLGAESTGNALRESYSSLPKISPTNTVILPGDASMEEMIRDTEKGLVVKDLQGAHSSNPDTGEYSVVATPAWYIDNGVLRPVRNIMLAGNIYADIKTVDLVGKETDKWIHLWSPPIRFRSLRVVVG